MMKSGKRSMYSSHPGGNELRCFATASLVEATLNECAIPFTELLEMRCVVERLADDIAESSPALIPFFATGGIPFAIPAMQVLYDRELHHFVDGHHFHMFPGLSWDGKLGEVDSEAFFAAEFGKLITQNAPKDGGLHIWTMDATFTGNAIRKLIKSLHRVFVELENQPENVTVSVVAVIDASRASKEEADDMWPLQTVEYGTLYLKRSSEFSPTGELTDRRPTKFARTDGSDLFDLEITYWPVSAIPTEDHAELIGARAKKGVLGIDSLGTVGRLTVDFPNGYSPSGTGGGSMASRILNWLSKRKDQLPWSKWIPLSDAAPVQPQDRADYEEGARQAEGGLRIFELLHSEEPSTAVSGLLSKPDLLNDVEVFCLLEIAKDEHELKLSKKLQRKVVASARKEPNATADALQLFRVCNPEIALGDSKDLDEVSRLDWWDVQLKRE